MSTATSLNPSALTALFALNAFQKQLTATTTSLATGLSIKTPAQIIASSQLKSTLAYLDAESSSLQQASNAAATADGALSNISSQLTDAKAITVKLAGGTYSEEEQAALQAELDSIVQSIDSTVSGATFNSQPLLDGTLTLSAAGESITLPNLSTQAQVTVDGETYALADVASIEDPAVAQEVIEAVQDQVTTAQGSLGAFQTNTLDSYQSVVNASAIQLAAADSAINDTDFAASTTLLSQQQILSASALLVLDIINDAQSGLIDLLA